MVPRGGGIPKKKVTTPRDPWKVPAAVERMAAGPQREVTIPVGMSPAETNTLLLLFFPHPPPPLPGVLYNQFLSQVDFEVLRDHARALGVLVFENPGRRLMVVTPGGHPDVKRFWKRQKHSA